MLHAKLVVVGGGDAKVTEFILQLPTSIGRSRESTLKLPHPLVSRRHCELFEREGQLIVRDLGSLNGTYIDSHKIDQEQALRPNQLLTLGTVTFRAVYEAVDSVSAPSHPDAAPDPSERPTQPAASGQASADPVSRLAAQNDANLLPVDEKISDTPGIGAYDFSAIGEPKNSTPEVASTIFVDTGANGAGGSVSLSEISHLPSVPANLSFKGGVQTGDPTAPDVDVTFFPSLSTGDEKADDSNSARRRPR